jgi:hypothetical protein
VTSTTTNVVLAAAIAALAVPVYAADGILIVQQTTIAGKTDTNHTQIEKTRMRAESTRPTGGKTVVLFDGPTQVIRFVDDAAKTYNEMTKADVDGMGAQMAGLTAQMQQAMANMSPEQRAQVEAMMKARGGGVPGAGGPPARTEYTKVGTDKVGKWTCDKYEGFRNGEKTSEVCTVDPKVLGITPADLEITRQLADFFSKMAPQTSDVVFRVGSGADKMFAGVPVRTSTFGARPMVMEITEVGRQNFSDSTFVVPSDYQKVAFGGRGRGRQ